MPSKSQREGFIQRSWQRALEDQACYKAISIRYALCVNKDLNGGCISKLGRMPVDTDVYRASDFADDFCKTI